MSRSSLLAARENTKGAKQSRTSRCEERITIRIEVIVQSVDDARAATEGGADRLEVVRDIREGGLTPSLELVVAIAKATTLPLRVMVRENSGFETTREEMQTMRTVAAELAAMNVDGLVVGFASDGELRLGDLSAVVDAAPRLAVTFHRAFDSLLRPLGAIDAICAFSQVDAILTGGGEGSAAARCNRLREYVDRAASRVAIIAGGGVNLEMFRLLVEQHVVSEIHVGRLARATQNAKGPVAAASVRRLRNLADDVNPR